MGPYLFAKLQQIWASWDVRCFVLLSLFLQSLLLLIAPFRKQSGNMLLHIMVWLTYQVADVTALFANGLISETQSAHPTSVSSRNNISEVMVFWSPFLLVHLGGPDTITAISLEDNELWMRHLLKLGGQIVSTVLVFYRSLPTNELLLPTILMFIAGIIKYSERIRSLHRASFKKINTTLVGEPEPGPNYAKFMEECKRKYEARMPIPTQQLQAPHKRVKFMSQKRLDDMEESVRKREMVRVGYRYYKKFRGLVADLIFSSHESQECRKYLLEQGAENAFRVMEIELNFMYDVLYTKAVITHERAQLGYLFRFFYSVLLLVTFGLWYFKDKKSQHFDPYDVKITYNLLFGAIALDVVSICMLISSDWMIALATKKEEKEDKTIGESCIIMISRTIDKVRFAASRYLPKRASSIISRRWSESIQQHNLIDFCLQENRPSDKLYLCMGIQDVMDDFKHVMDPRKFCSGLRDLIFCELKRKSEEARIEKNEKPKYEDRGEWVLKRVYNCSDTLSDWIGKVEYDESIILWHIATDVCYIYDEVLSQSTEDRTDQSSGGDSDEEALRQDNESTHGNYKQDSKREMSKVLSDYMFYLLIREPKMMAEVSSISPIRFRDTVEEANIFIENLWPKPRFQCLAMDPNNKRKRRHFIIKKLWDVNTIVPPKEMKTDGSKSVLFDGCNLARKLQNEISLEVDKWELISSVWVEMLSYAAVHCRGNVHTAQLGKGGHLVSIVWLLMSHLGLGKQYESKGLILH